MAVLWLAIFYAAKILTNEQNTKLALIFYSECSVSSPFTAKIVKTSEKHEVYFNVFHSECKLSSRFTSKILRTCVIMAE